MSITQLYTNDEFYTSTDPKDFKIGQICWVPIPNPDPIPRILDVQRNTPEEHEEVKFELRLANQRTDFKTRDRSLPIKYLNMRSNEELLAQTCKKRPSIILATGAECYPDIASILRQKGKKHQQQDCIFVIPCYSVQIEEYGPGFIQPIVERTKCLMYRQFFYLPLWNRTKDLIARFDRVQVVIDRSPASIEPTDVCLSEEIFNLFLSMFLFCISGKTNELLEDVKELVREAYSEE
ncbi:MAG: hypothetical protein ABIJ52_18680 [Pseudomonadota bacterium]|nr:hypothetical protein [Pseudomonadota bacterium]